MLSKSVLNWALALKGALVSTTTLLCSRASGITAGLVVAAAKLARKLKDTRNFMVAMRCNELREEGQKNEGRGVRGGFENDRPRRTQSSIHGANGCARLRLV